MAEEPATEGDAPVLNLNAVRASLSDAARILSELGPASPDDEDEE